ncbi:MAG: DUF4249 family protein [Prolixibacteraceae bacterium]|nr:DUF4249 family protein [Prolixibacteraceae bacterium]
MKAIQSITRYSLMALTLLALACEDTYIPEIESTANSLVLEAILTDKPDIMKLRLSRTVPFDGRSFFNGERDASVWLKSTNNESYRFYQASSGIYHSEDTIRTKEGVGYYLDIKTDDGEQYLTEVEVMLAKNDIEKVVFEDSIHHEVNYDYWGEPFVRDFDGIYISVLPQQPENQATGYLYKWKSLVNYYIYSVEAMMEFSYYCWKNIQSNTIYVYDYDQFMQGNTLKLDNIHFLSYFYLYPSNIDSSEFKGTIQQAYASSFYYYIEQYTISKKGAEFWESVKNQSEATGKLFDPVEENINTNMYCVSNPALKCYGFFNTASYAERIIVVDIDVRKIKRYFTVESFPVPKKMEDCLENKMSEFWY